MRSLRYIRAGWWLDALVPSAAATITDDLRVAVWLIRSGAAGELEGYSVSPRTAQDEHGSPFEGTRMG
jgi:hypothetical protein